MKRHTLKWFLNRVGKRVFRLTYFKCCPTCQDVFDNGMVIFDEQSADYLFLCQNEQGLEYSDKK